MNFPDVLDTFSFWIVLVSSKLANLTGFEVNAQFWGGAVDYYTLSTARGSFKNVKTLILENTNDLVFRRMKTNTSMKRETRVKQRT